MLSVLSCHVVCSQVASRSKASGCEPWLAIIYDRLARRQWSERTQTNEPGFQVKAAARSLCKELLMEAEAEFKRYVHPFPMSYAAPCFCAILVARLRMEGDANNKGKGKGKGQENRPPRGMQEQGTHSPGVHTAPSLLVCQAMVGRTRAISSARGMGSRTGTRQRNGRAREVRCCRTLYRLLLALL